MDRLPSASPPILRLYVATERHRVAARPYNRFNTFRIDPNKRYPHQFLEKTKIEMVQLSPGRGYKFHIHLVDRDNHPTSIRNMAGRTTTYFPSVEFRLTDKGDWEYRPNQLGTDERGRYSTWDRNGPRTLSNGAPVEDEAWSPLGDNVVSSHHEYFRNAYGLHAFLESSEEENHTPLQRIATANRLVSLNAEPKAYTKMVVVPGAWTNVSKDERGRIKIEPSDVVKNRIEEGLRELLVLNKKGEPAALVFSGGPLHYHLKNPPEGFTKKELQGLTEAQAMQQYMNRLINSDEMLQKWWTESTPEQREDLPKTAEEIRELLGNPAAHMYSEERSTDLVGNALFTGLDVLGGDDGESFQKVREIRLIIEKPFASRFLETFRHLLPAYSVKEVHPPDKAPPNRTIERYMDEFLKRFDRDRQKLFRENPNQGVSNLFDFLSQVERWTQRNHRMYLKGVAKGWYVTRELAKKGGVNMAEMAKRGVQKVRAWRSRSRDE